MADIRCRLSTIMGCRRITQKRLCEDSGLAPATVNRLFNENWMGIERQTLIKLCKALNVEVGDLFIYEK